jgi:hypothetical protein
MLLEFVNAETKARFAIQAAAILFVGEAPEERGGILLGVVGGTTLWVNGDYKETCAEWDAALDDDGEEV